MLIILVGDVINTPPSCVIDNIVSNVNILPSYYLINNRKYNHKCKRFHNRNMKFFFENDNKTKIRQNIKLGCDSPSEKIAKNLVKLKLH